MPNPYVNKVELSSGETLIDISDTTAVASDVAQGKYFYAATGEKLQGTATGGGTAAISVVDTLDSHGGTIRTITATDISDTTAIASDVAQGKYFYTSAGVKTTGTASGGSSGQSLTGTFTGDNSNTAQIQCSFAPDVINIYGDLSGDVTNRGVVVITIVKDNTIYALTDSSTSSTMPSPTYYNVITGYNESDSSNPHATYSNGVLTIDMVYTSTSARFLSGITYSYELSTLGSGSGGSSTLITKSISANGTYSASSDSADGYSQVTVAAPNSYSQSDEGKVVSNGALVSQTSQNITTNGTYNTTLKNEVVVNVSGGETPSATAHTIYFEFTDSTDATINAWYNDSFISDAITATTPTTYGQKTVDSASLDSVTWYTRPTETWETLWDNVTDFYHDQPNYPYCWISDLGDTPIPLGSLWRVTFDSVEYRLTGYASTHDANYGAIGNPKFLPSGGTDDGSGVPLGLCQTAWGAWTGSADVLDDTRHNLKIERLVIS